MSRNLRLSALLLVALSLGSLAADELPPRAVARLGDYRFGNGAAIDCAAINHDGSRVATITKGTGPNPQPLCTVWDADTGKELCRWQLPEGSGYALVFSPDGKQVIAPGNSDRDKQPTGYVCFYQADTGKLARQLGPFANSVKWVQFSADGKRLHVGEFSDSTVPAVSSWDAATGERRARWEAPAIPVMKTDEETTTTTVYDGLLSPDGKILLWTVSQDTERPKDAERPMSSRGLLLGFDTATGKKVYELPCDYYPDELLFSHDGKRFVRKSESFRVLDTATGESVFELDSSQNPIGVNQLLPDGRRGLVYFEGDIRTCDLKSGTILSKIPPILIHYFGEYRTQLSRDGKTLLLASPTTICLWDVATGKERTPAPGHRQRLDSVWFAADGKTLVSQSYRTFCQWDVAKGTQVRGSALFDPPGESVDGRSTDGRFVLVRGEKTMIVRETNSGKVVCQLGRNQGGLLGQGVFSPEGNKVAVRPFQPDKGLYWFDAVTGKRLGGVAEATCADEPTFSPGGRLLAWATTGQRIAVAKVHNGELLPLLGDAVPEGNRRKYVPHQLLALSHDGEFLAASSHAHYDGQLSDGVPLPLRVFRLRDGREMFHFFSPTGDEMEWVGPDSLAFSPDGRLLAVGERRTKKVRVLEVSTGRTRIELTGHRGSPTALAFSPDGKLLASGGEDNVIYLWDVIGARTKGSDRVDLRDCWADLGADPARAGDALAGLLRAPERSVPLLRERLRPAEATDEKRLTRLIAGLDADDFEKREAATRELARLEETAEAALRRALTKHPSDEKKRRVEELLNRLDGTSPEAVQRLRALEALEHIGTPEARKLLAALADGSPEARLTRDAKAALKRLEK
jgi:WD40 repeat protein